MQSNQISAMGCSIDPVGRKELCSGTMYTVPCGEVPLLRCGEGDRDRDFANRLMNFTFAEAASCLLSDNDPSIVSAFL